MKSWQILWFSDLFAFYRVLKWTCGWIVLKFCKKQTKYENQRFVKDIMISYVVAKVNNWEGFAQVMTCAPLKS